MLRHRKRGPFDWRLCDGSVTAQIRALGGQVQVTGVHFERTRGLATQGGVSRPDHKFLLVIPYDLPIAPGDRVEDMGVQTVQRRTLYGEFSHLEVRG